MTFTVSSFNVHWGGRVPGGRTEYDLAAACRTFDADVRIFQEVWHHPEEPSRLWVPDDFTVHELAVAQWARPKRFELPAPLAGRVGTMNVVLATRFATLDRRILRMPAARRDPRREALALLLATPLGPVWVVAVHLTIGLLPLGSARQVRALGPQVPTDAPAVIAGDHNQWGPPARLLLGRAWRPAVKGKTWPAPRQRHQIDHIWTRGLASTGGRVLPDLGSDHLAVAATITAAPTAAGNGG